MKKWFVAISVAFAIVFFSTGLWRDAAEWIGNQRHGMTPEQWQAYNQIIQLYENRVEAAEIERRSDMVKLNFAKNKYEKLKHIFENGAATSEFSVLEAKRDYEMFMLEVEADDNMIREANLQMQLMRLGIDAGAVNLDDLRIPTELLRHR